MSLSTEQAAFLLDMCKLIQYATDQGFVVTGGELARTPEQQAIYGAYWETLHPKNRWGGNFKSLVDCPHFERNVG